MNRYHERPHAFVKAWPRVRAIRALLACLLAPQLAWQSGCNADGATATDPPPSVQPPPTTHPFPVGPDSTNRYLVDGDGHPFLIHGDAGWSLLVQLTREQTERYLEDRRAKGFNAIIVNLIESAYADDPPRNAYGAAPFTKEGDFATPNEAYFEHVDWALTRAAEKGIVFLLNPAYMGFQGRSVDVPTDGWWAELETNGPDRSRAYGRWLGRRYRNFPNIIWVAGGDRIPPDDEDGTRNFLALLQGIREEAPDQLWTGHWNNNVLRFEPGAPQSLDIALFRPYMDINGVYTYAREGGFVHDRMLDAYDRPGHRPTFLWESYYEGPHPDYETTTPAMIRRQAFEADLAGSTGQVSGSMYIWNFGSRFKDTQYDWEAHLDSPDSRALQALHSLLTPRRWYDLVPDRDHSLITDGFGTRGTATYVSAAATPDGTFALAYLPPTGTASRSLTVHLGNMTGTVTARWFNPTNGTYQPIAGSPFPSRGSRPFKSPGNNGTGTNDWVLVLESTP